MPERDWEADEELVRRYWRVIPSPVQDIIFAALAERRRLAALLEWKPIETAPKDRDILLLCPSRGVVRGSWNNDCHKKPRPYWTNDRERIFGVTETRADQPTHWMPLPEPPKAEAKE